MTYLLAALDALSDALIRLAAKCPKCDIGRNHPPQDDYCNHCRGTGDVRGIRA